MPDEIKKPRNVIILVFVAVAFGFVAGFFVGGSLIRETVWRLNYPSMAAPGEQARRTLVLVESGRLEEAKRYLEAEVDNTIEFLQSLDEKGELQKGSPTSNILDRLMEHRDSRQVVSSQQSSIAMETSE